MYEEARKAEEKAKEKWAGRFRAWGQSWDSVKCAGQFMFVG